MSDNNIGWTRADREADEVRYRESKAAEAAAREAEMRGHNRAGLIGVLVLVVAVGAIAYGCARMSDDAPTGGSDASATQACAHYGNVSEDVSSGTLTGDELREKVKEINDTASGSEADGIASNAERMLSAITAGDALAFQGSASDFAAACNDLD